VQVEVHYAQTARVRYELEAAREVAAQVPLLVQVERMAVFFEDALVGGEEEAARAARGVADGVSF
jgi:hypothetical protein